ncbi:MAG: dTDP-4-dehydrorhamnose 3,5-epimerase [Candidatus Niyogibacteria bacterium CG10_big_fil_rev_8_21_14_0_10_46_36]|uniref:dTDP-4-dehydrorhamnose 3,5-epimerase n=1 Tax=Candidatus Niyogibacteria bacterium CG10_big_fil_rev_8_21_14_0_10_46_36 TaxID=1974726 RepID=A0A2H0TEP5_9BACT|nr:MAG: dTDP-4-dehydrorhamnose 3,5-epimerase [Candidatus Niyogibacteria bacterium CG10_big_fil_rev_8_21_14_0_10_46_36]
MKFIPTTIDGVYIIELEKREDDRGFLARTWCEKEFRDNGIDVTLAQGYVSGTKCKGTIRGIHWQTHPRAETKLTRCNKGALFEVVTDVRPDSPTYKKWEGFTFRADDYRMLFMPKGVGHAILTLEDDTEFTNFSDTAYSPEHERGMRYDDGSFSVRWPISVEHVSEKDKAWGPFMWA